ncbi:MAG: lamin tail domain-containing protein [Pseudomonadota bacterium]
MGRSFPGAIVWLMGMTLGCASEEWTSPCPALLAGDLVITEVMADPAGRDTGGEWIELVNTTGRRLDIAGLVLAAGSVDEAEQSAVMVGQGVVEPDEYFVLANVADDERPAHVRYGYGSGLKHLRNRQGRIAVSCRGTMVDEVSYGETRPAVSLSFDGAKPPDYLANDDLASWCASPSEYAPGLLGSPGHHNQPCLPISNRAGCLDEGQSRGVVPPQPGGLTITELMPNPAKADDSTGEWFELRLDQAVDLNGLQIGTTVDRPLLVVESPECVRVEPGSYLVFSRSLDSAINGQLSSVGRSFDFTLPNRNGRLVVSVGGWLLDEVSWDSAPAGRSLSLDPERTSASANDSPAYWCEATTSYGAGDFGTPGAANPKCPLVASAGKCVDGANVRDLTPPLPGDLAITELLANPAAVGDSAGEWFEIYASTSFDLNGLELGNDPAVVRTTIESTECLHASAGSYLVFGRSKDSTRNGGIPELAGVVDFSLVNSNGSLFVGHNGTVLDSVAWKSSVKGSARSLDPKYLDPGENDDDSRFCSPTIVYGAGDRGTPGSANQPCE